MEAVNKGGRTAHGRSLHPDKEIQSQHIVQTTAPIAGSPTRMLDQRVSHSGSLWVSVFLYVCQRFSALI